MRSVDGGPRLHNRHDLLCGHVGKGDVVRRRECQDIALPSDRLCSEQQAWKAGRDIRGSVFCL